jgi:arsenite methyltransferase
MMQLIAKMHGITAPETPDYGQDVPGLAKGSAMLGLLSSGIVISHLVAFSSAGLFVMLRGGTNLSLGNVIFITTMTILSILFFSISGFLIWSSRRGKLQMRDRVIADLKLNGDEDVLDVGCGNGLLVIGAAAQLTSGTVTGVDIWREDIESDVSPQSVMKNAELAGVADRVRVESADARNLPFENGRFDIITTSFMLHHMNKADRETAVREMARVLKPKGKLVIVEIAHAKQLASILGEIGFTNIRQPSLNLPLYKQIVAQK